MTTLIQPPGRTVQERTTYTLDSTQTWRQVGWLGFSGRVYALDDEAGVRSEPGGFQPLWILAFNEPPVIPDDAVD